MSLSSLRLFSLLFRNMLIIIEAYPKRIVEILFLAWKHFLFVLTS
nr:MAG TPA: hypothetical protein [Caudoviricetes sp.]